MFLMRSAFSLQGLWRESNHCLSNLSVRGKSEKKDMYFVWVKVLLRTGICRTLLVLRRRPLLHTQIPGGFQHCQTHSYLLLERFRFPWAPSHSCFQWKRWVPHSDLCYHGLKKLLLSSYGWNQNARRVAIRVNKASPNHQDFDQYCGLTQTHVKPGPLDYGNILKERILSFAFQWQKNPGHCRSIASNPEKVSRERQ